MKGNGLWFTYRRPNSGAAAEVNTRRQRRRWRWKVDMSVTVICMPALRLPLLSA